MDEVYSSSGLRGGFFFWSDSIGNTHIHSAITIKLSVLLMAMFLFPIANTHVTTARQGYIVLSVLTM